MGQDRLGQMLLREGLITEDQLNAAIGKQQTLGMRLGSCLIDMGMIEADTIAKVVGRQLHAKPILENEIRIDPDLIAKIPAEVAVDYDLLPLKAVGERLDVVIAEPNNYFGLDDLKMRTGFNDVAVYVAPQILIRNLIAKHYGQIRATAHPMGNDA